MFGNRIQREALTVAAMIRLYCRRRHGTRGGVPCASCRELLDYARARLARCPFGEGKTACARCAAHCYGAARREEIRALMREAGPRMAARHPLLALLHVLDGRRKAPIGPRR